MKHDHSNARFVLTIIALLAVLWYLSVAPKAVWTLDSSAGTHGRSATAQNRAECIVDAGVNFGTVNSVIREFKHSQV